MSVSDDFLCSSCFLEIPVSYGSTSHTFTAESNTPYALRHGSTGSADWTESSSPTEVPNICSDFKTGHYLLDDFPNVFFPYDSHLYR